MNPKTLEEARKIRYGNKHTGYYYRKERCVFGVLKYGKFWGYMQCSRKNGHGINGLYCQQHAKMVKE